MNQMNGIVLAKRLKEIYPQINIVFVTAYSKYTDEAFSLHASGYIYKPVTKDKIILDPGIGFGKTYEQNLEVLKRLGELKSLGYPILLGTSRKSVIGNTLNLPPQERVEGTIATTVLGIKDGVDIVRVHDVEKNLRAAKMADAIYRG